MESAGNIPNVGRENSVSPFGDSITIRWDDPPIIYHPRSEDQGIGSVPSDIVLDILGDRNTVLYERDRNEYDDWTIYHQQKDLIHEQLAEIRDLKRQLEDVRVEYKAYKRRTWERLRCNLNHSSQKTDVTLAVMGTRIEIVQGLGETSRAAKEQRKGHPGAKGSPSKREGEKGYR
ncbi:hypothetical protein Salat_1189000 [Sesamum alatum]|uniref:Uncharacterized protein n=1 Tax=Sesamum alatum TaxID=300844 RepID=A0AAE1YEM9_9LAMI|nr:hypothetical protein Salat_1189000 [Sesamum alatum]